MQNILAINKTSPTRILGLSTYLPVKSYVIHKNQVLSFKICQCLMSFIAKSNLQTGMQNILAMDKTSPLENFGTIKVSSYEEWCYS